MAGSSFPQASDANLRIVMMMTLPLQEETSYGEATQAFERGFVATSSGSVAVDKRPFHTFAEKLRVPRFEGAIERPRLDDLLEKSCRQFGATVLSGRAGTGKTTVAAGFASRYREIAWYSVESADSDWNVFSHYINAALMKTRAFGLDADVSIFETENISRSEEVSRFVSELFSRQVTGSRNSPLLIVLDDIQHLFDADWFNDFFTLMLHSLAPEVHLLMLCRSKPPMPLWRLRSKQRLNVIDEKLLAFSAEEAERLYREHGLTGDAAKNAHRASFGRASKLAAVLNSTRLSHA